MQTCVIWTILMFGFILTFVSCQNTVSPNDEVENIICAPGDELCDKFKDTIGDNQRYHIQKNIFGLSNQYGYEKFKPAVLKCNNRFNRWRCRRLGKICYTNGTCGDLVEEEAVTETPVLDRK